MKWSGFRGWVHNLWIENCNEHEEDRQPTLSEREYFNRHRWWLKREYTLQTKREKADQIRMLKEEFNVMKMRVQRLEEMNKMLSEECDALRQQLKYAEQQVYNGTTM